MAITTGKFSVYPVAYAPFGHSGDPPGVARDVRQSPHRFPVDANTLDRAFTVEAPNRVWAGDLTYVWTLEGLLYLGVLLALYSRRVVGWAMGQRLTAELPAPTR